MARAGLEDAIYELSKGYNWDFSSGNLSTEWEYLNATTFYKTNQNGQALSFVEYPVTFSVQIIGDINLELVTVNVDASISDSLNSQISKKSLQAFLSRSFDNEIIVHSIKTI